MTGLMKSAAALLMLTGCTTLTTATETEQALCDAWRDSLPTRSRSDTAQTQREVGQAYAMQQSICKDVQ